MSADLITYLNFIASFENATDDQLNDIMSERANFIAMGESNMMDMCNNAIDSVFDEIDHLAKQLEEEKIADDSIKVAEDEAAVASIWLFGWGMAAFIALEAIDAVLQYEIKKKEDELYEHLASADKDIADKIGGACAQYTDLTKKNNKFLKDSSPAGLSAQTARSYLYSHMDFLETHGGVTLDNFRKYIAAARTTKDSTDIDKIYDLLDEFSKSPDFNSTPQIKETLEKMHEILDLIHLVDAEADNIRHMTYHIWLNKLGVETDSLDKAIKELDGKVPDVDIFVLKCMKAIKIAMDVFTIVISAVDAFLNGYDIGQTIERYKNNIVLFNQSRQKYKSFYQQMYEASVQYKPPSAQHVSQ